MKVKKYKFLEHTADIKFKVHAESLNEIFNNSALAVSEILSRGEKIKNTRNMKIKLKAEDNESLLYDFIDELIYLLDAKNFVVSKAVVKIENGRLNGTVYGDNSKDYPDLDHIKAATYAEMYVKRVRGGSWEAQVVVDV